MQCSSKQQNIIELVDMNENKQINKTKRFIIMFEGVLYNINIYLLAKNKFLIGKNYISCKKKTFSVEGTTR